MPLIGIFKVGYLAVDVIRICEFLNRAQNHYEFKRASTVVNMGEPDLFNYGYSDRALLNLVQPHVAEYDFIAILLSVPIEDNYFTRSVDNKFIIATSYQSDALLPDSGRSIEEYYILAMCQELISFEFQRVTHQHWTNLFHKDPRGCIFDFAGIKSQKLAKLRTCEICPPCKGKLSSINMNDNILNSLEAILDKIRRPSIAKALHLSIKSSFHSFIYGGIIIGAAVNVLSSVFMGREPLSTGQNVIVYSLVLAIPIFPLIVYCSLWYRYFQRRMKNL